MNTLIKFGSAILVVLCAGAAFAQDSTKNDGSQSVGIEGPTGQDPITNSGGAGAGEGKRRAHTMPEGAHELDKPPLRLTGEQREMVRDAVVAEHVAQSTPKGYEPKIGAAVPKSIKPNPLPRPLVYRIEVLKRYDYAKLDRNLLIIDPMSMTIADIIPRKSPSSGAKLLTAPEWVATRGRSLIGLPPQTMGEATKAGEAK